MGEEADAAREREEDERFERALRAYMVHNPVKAGIADLAAIKSSRDLLALFNRGRTLRLKPARIADMARAVKAEVISPPLDHFTRAHLRKLLTLRGQWTGLSWCRELKTLKGVTSTVTKEVRCVARVGLDYDHLKATVAGREDGSLPPINGGLPWGRWALFPYLIKHKGKVYVRIYPSPKGCKVIYRLNGQMARFEEVRPLCRASEFSDETPGCITLTATNLRRVRAGERQA